MFEQTWIELDMSRISVRNTYIRTGANNRSHDRVIFARCNSVEVLEIDILDDEVALHGLQSGQPFAK
jgi:hypothetical protein